MLNYYNERTNLINVLIYSYLCHVDIKSLRIDIYNNIPHLQYTTAAHRTNCEGVVYTV